MVQVCCCTSVRRLQLQRQSLLSGPLPCGSRCPRPDPHPPVGASPQSPHQLADPQFDLLLLCPTSPRGLCGLDRSDQIPSSASVVCYRITCQSSTGGRGSTTLCLHNLLFPTLAMEREVVSQLSDEGLRSGHFCQQLRADIVPVLLSRMGYACLSIHLKRPCWNSDPDVLGRWVLMLMRMSSSARSRGMVGW